MSNNFNGLLTTKQVAYSANIEDSCYFVLNTDPVMVDTLSADNVVANTVVSGVVEVNTNIDLNGGILTVSGGNLELDGVPIGGGSADAWATFPAVQDVDMSANDINNISTIRGVGTDFIFAKSPLQVLDVANSLPNTFGYSVTNIQNNAVGGASYGLDIASIGSTQVNGRASGIVISSPFANNTGGTARGILMQDIQGTNTVGLELRGGNNGTNARGIWEHHADAGVINTFMHNVGIGKDPVGAALDVSGNARIKGQLDMSANKIINLATPTDNADATTKLYVDTAASGGGSAWSTYPALQTVDISGYTLDNVATIASLDASGSQITLDTPGTLMTGVAGTANLLILGGANRTDISNAGVNITTRKVISGGGNGETIGQYNFSGQTNTGVTRIYGQLTVEADSILNGGEQSRVSLYARRTGGNVPFVVCDGSKNTVVMERGITLGGTGDRGIEECGFIGNTGVIDISASDGVNGDIFIRASDDITLGAADAVSMTAGGTMSIAGSDLNLNCTGLTSVLNINSVLGTLLASVGAIDITAGGTTAINSTGNVTIGSLGTTSIENFNLNNSVLTKVAATSNLELNDIGSLNSTTNGSLIDSKATLQVSLTTSTGPAIGFQAQGVATTADDAAGLLSSNVSTSFTGGTAYGVFVTNTVATDGIATGIKVEEINGTTAGTGIEITGNITGTTKRGIYEHAAVATGVKNTFINPLGVGKDPAGVYALDVLGQTNITAAVGGRANPTLSLTSTSAAAPGAYLQFYHNSTTPDVGDRAGVMDFYGNNASAIKKEYARIRTLQDGNVNGAEKGTIEMSVVTNGSMTTYFDVDGSNNGVVINPDKAVVGSFKMYDSVGVATNNTLINADAIAGNVMLKNYPQQYVYDIAGSYTLTMPTGFNVMRVLMFGAGGGGGSGRKGAVGTACAGGGGGGGGNGGELWFSRRELFPDASGSMTFYVFVGQGGAGGAAVTLDDTNGNNGAAGAATSINLVNSFFVSMLYYQMSGGNGGGGGTNTTGTGGGGASFSGSGNIGSSGRSGGTSTIVGQPDRVLTGIAYCGTIFNSTGGSGAGGGMSAANAAFPGAIFTSPAGQKFNGLGANVNKAGSASAVADGGAGSVVTFDGILNAAIKPVSGGCDMAGGGGASSAVNFSGGAGGEIPAGQPGGRGSGGGGGGAARNGTGTSGRGGKGADGLIYITFW